MQRQKRRRRTQVDYQVLDGGGHEGNGRIIDDGTHDERGLKHLSARLKHLAELKGNEVAVTSSELAGNELGTSSGSGFLHPLLLKHDGSSQAFLAAVPGGTDFKTAVKAVTEVATPPHAQSCSVICSYACNRCCIEALAQQIEKIAATDPKYRTSSC